MAKFRFALPLSALLICGCQTGQPVEYVYRNPQVAAEMRALANSGKQPANGTVMDDIVMDEVDVELEAHSIAKKNILRKSFDLSNRLPFGKRSRNIVGSELRATVSAIKTDVQGLGQTPESLIADSVNNVTTAPAEFVNELKTATRSVATKTTKTPALQISLPTEQQPTVTPYKFTPGTTIKLDTGADNQIDLIPEGTNGNVRTISYNESSIPDLIPDSLDEVPPPPPLGKVAANQSQNNNTPMSVVPGNMQSIEPKPLGIEPGQFVPAEAGINADATAAPAQNYPVDLPAVLKLTGADNWSVRLAEERVREADAGLTAAKSMWFPSLNLAVGWNKHEGPLQAAAGQVIDVSRGSLFAGGGAVVQNSSLTGASNGPSRMQVDLSLADAIFQPLAAKQKVKLAHSSHNRVFNDTQLEAGLAYYDLVAAQGRFAASLQNENDARKLAEMTDAFVSAGKAAQGEVQRVDVVATNRKQQRVQAELDMKIASANLARILQLDELKLGHGSVLHSVEQNVAELKLIGEEHSLEALIAQGQSTRAEASEATAMVDVRDAENKIAKYRPWLPNVNVGVSGGSFGGGNGSSLDNTGGRFDVDAQLVWQLRNLGAGTAADQRATRSRYEQELIKSYRVRDIIAAEVKAAWHAVAAQKQQIQLTRDKLGTALAVYERNITRIRGLEGLPIEAIQAINALADARFDFLEAVIGYNKSQLTLLRAIGEPLDRE